MPGVAGAAVGVSALAVGSLRRCCWSRPTHASRSTIPGAAIPSARPGSQAVLDGLAAADLDDAVTRALGPRRDPRRARAGAHAAPYLDQLEAFCAARRRRPRRATRRRPRRRGRRRVLAAGRRARGGRRARARARATAAFCAVRPPGHHAEPGHAMGFCLLNNVAVTAAALRDRGERVLDRRLGRAPRQRHPGHLLRPIPTCCTCRCTSGRCIPGTGRLDDIGDGRRARARPSTSRSPRARPATSTSTRSTSVVAPLAERFAPDWVLVSAGLRRPPGRPAHRPRALRRATSPT